MSDWTKINLQWTTQIDVDATENRVILKKEITKSKSAIFNIKMFLIHLVLVYFMKIKKKLIFYDITITPHHQHLPMRDIPLDIEQKSKTQTKQFEDRHDPWQRSLPIEYFRFIYSFLKYFLFNFVGKLLLLVLCLSCMLQIDKNGSIIRNKITCSFWSCKLTMTTTFFYRVVSPLDIFVN